MSLMKILHYHCGVAVAFHVDVVLWLAEESKLIGQIVTEAALEMTQYLMASPTTAWPVRH